MFVISSLQADALSVGETKDILQVLNQRRDWTVPNTNGNGLSKGDVTLKEEALIEESLDRSPFISTTVSTPPSSILVEGEADELDQALVALDELQAAKEKAGHAVMLVDERLKKVNVTVIELKQQLADKELEIEQLKGDLEKAKQVIQENAAISLKNNQLEAEIKRLRTLLDDFGNLIQRAKSSSPVK